ncbi:hypothetical protein CYMTET_15544 [Cymbomonas tetramitiformis]|uniref:Uncharacterized protein n=1 Tax=Cymbomonas tetramitiformis TaxID=36881 RepID=A0AAE0GE42_9CHLO|nr:hypothetical protein CYMTET_15544 [Cymbomonas tetramitiformis]
MKYEYIVLAPALSYFHDFLKYTSATVTGFETFETDELYDILVRLENSIHGVYTLLCNRFTVLQLRASLDGEGASKSDADSLRAKLKFVEDCVYQSSEGLVTDSLLKEYLDEFDKGKHKAAMYANMKLAALVETGNTRGGGRGADGCWRDEKKEQSPAGGKGKGKGRGKASHRATPGLMPRDVRGTLLPGACASWRRTESPHDSRRSEEEKRGVARGGRQCRGPAVDLQGSQDALASATSPTVRPLCVATPRDSFAADLAGQEDRESAGDRGLEASIAEAARVSCVLGEEAGREPVAPGGGLLMAEQFLCEVKG